MEVIPIDQYEGHKVHSAIETGYNKNILFGISETGGWSAGIVSDDSNMYYNRMQYIMVSYCCQIWGFWQPATNIILNSI